MRSTSKLCCAIAILATTATVASAADYYRHHVTYRGAPYAFGGAYASSAGSERGYGTSVPYDADGPSYNDFQLQGR